MIGNAEIKELLNLTKMNEFVKSLKRRTTIDVLIRSIKSYKIKKVNPRLVYQLLEFYGLNY